MPKGRTPSYRLHKASGQAVVTISGHDHYLGRHGSDASRKAYDALIGRWMAGGRGAVVETDRGATVSEVVVGFWAWAKGYYVKDGKETSQLWVLKPALEVLHRLYGDTPAAEFSPSKLKVLRQHWVDSGVSRPVVNRKANVVRQCFSWAVEHEMVPGGVSHALKAVKNLAYGRTTAPERPRVLPVPQGDVEAAMPFLAPRDAAMVRLQLATGMRPGEACVVRPVDVDRSGEVWTYRPHRHKSQHHGKDRVVFLGPEARAILAPLIARAASPESYLFRCKGGGKGVVGRVVTENAYCRAIGKGCRKAGIEVWTPNRLRHSAGTRIRAKYGIEVARILLGHSSAVTSEIYSEVDEKKAREVVEEMG